MEDIQRMERERRNLRIFSTLFLILAAVDAVNMILFFAGGGANVPELARQAQASESLVRASVIVIIAIGVLSILVLVYLGWMGLRQCNGKTTATAHITIAKICVVFLVIGFVIALINVISAVEKDWVDLCSSLASVCIGLSYIRAAKSVTI